MPPAKASLADEATTSGPRRPGNSANEIVTSIREAIRGGELVSGMQIRQSDWAARLGVSRVPVREALTALVAQGLLEHSPHQGYFVAHSSDNQARQLYRLRHLIDRELAQALPWPTEEQLAVLRPLAEAAAEAQRHKDVVGWLDANEQFTFAVYDLSTDEVYAAEARRLWRRCELHRAQRIARLIAAFDADIPTLGIIDALERQDRAALLERLGRTTDLEVGPPA
ncbi:MAG: GntR family transcriptional regulator [Actinomycetia bacterium]|nr:GntR family transcriptional regulator [Actinomycetes bacterium]